MSFKVKSNARPERIARFERRFVNGMSRVYPTNPNAVTLTSLTGKSRKAVNDRELALMSALGYEVKVDEPAGTPATEPTPIDSKLREQIVELIGDALKQMKQGGTK